MFTWFSIWLVYSVHFCFCLLYMYLYVGKNNKKKKVTILIYLINFDFFFGSKVAQLIPKLLRISLTGILNFGKKRIGYIVLRPVLKFYRKLFETQETCNSVNFTISVPSEISIFFFMINHCLP